MIQRFKVFHAGSGRHDVGEDPAQVLALQYGWPLTESQELGHSSEAIFAFEQERLQLWLELEGNKTSLSFDLVDGEVGFRAARVSKSNEVVAKAIGCKPHYRPRVLDATAGMGRDAFIMAMLGCEVVMQERNPAIYCLLDNALSRMRQQAQFADAAARLTLAANDSTRQFAEGTYDVIYLDPMFPERKKSALVKKEMRLFKLLAGEDPDADLLLDNGLKQAVKRVVVKRPKGAPNLNNLAPSHIIQAKKFRYDVYLTG